MARSISRLVLFVAALLVFATHVHAASVTVAWDPNPEPNVRYVVYWGMEHGVYPNTISAGTNTSYLVSDLTPGRTYYFAVQAVTADGLTSPFSDEVSATIPLPPSTGKAVAGDRLGDGRSHPSVFRKSVGEHYSQGLGGVRYGAPGDVPVPGDYDGDGVIDLAVYRPSTGEWWVVPSSTGLTFTVQWGNPGSADIPVPADYDGDLKTDPAIYRPETGEWWILKSTTTFSYQARIKVQWGNPGSGDIPVPADYDGDGRADIAVYRAQTGTWWILKSTDNYSYSTRQLVQWGDARSGDRPVPADYDGDGRADIAVWRPTTGHWWILKSSDNYSYGTRLLIQYGVGSEGDIPVPGDYDGDGKADIAVWRPSIAYWFVRLSSGNYNTYAITQYGNAAAGDVPLLATTADLSRLSR